MKNKLLYILVFSLITGTLWLTVPGNSRAGQYDIGTLDSISNSDGSANSSGNPADQSMTVYGTNNTETLPQTVFQTCGGQLIIDGVYNGDVAGDLSAISVYTGSLANGSHTVSVQPNNCSSEFTATGTNSLTFYVNHPQKCSISISRSVNGGAAFTTGSYNYNVNGPSPVSFTNGDRTVTDLAVGNYTIIPNADSSSVNVTYQSRTFVADASSNSVTCTANTTVALPLPYITQPDLDLQ